MKKLILVRNEVKEMEFDENFINTFKPLAVSTFKKYKNGTQMTEDELQDLDVIMYECFLKYNGEYHFTTFLTAAIKNYGMNTINLSKTAKRDSSRFQFVDLDQKYNTNKSEGREMHIYETVGDINVDIENSYIEYDFIQYLNKHLSEFELDLLSANLNDCTFKEVCLKYGLSKTCVSNRNYKFKERVKNLISIYNKIELN